ncbi:MAG: T9SS type A sorting domain-containing protein [candidate division WOR-3 bacterium]
MPIIVLFLDTLGFSPPIWPNWKYDRQLTGRCPYIGPEQPEIDWVFDTQDTFRFTSASVVISGDSTIYFCSPDSFLFAVKPNGVLKWRFKTRGRPYFPAIDESGRIYCSVAGDSIYLLTLDDSITYAKFVWSWSMPNNNNLVALPPINIGVDKTTYMSADSMRAIDSAGNIKWTCHRGMTSAYPPALSHDGSKLFYEWCYDQWTNTLASRDTSGALNWYRVIGPAPMSLAWGSPAIGRDSAIYFSTADGRLLGLWPNNTDKWAPPNNLGALNFMTVSLGSNDTLWLMNYGKRPTYRKFSPDNGIITFIDSVTTLPSVYNFFNSYIIDSLGQAYIVLRDSQTTSSILYAFNADGTVKWSIPLTGSSFTPRSFPAIGPNHKIYVCAGTKLFAIRDGSNIAESKKERKKPFFFDVYPNPFTRHCVIEFQIPSRHSDWRVKSRSEVSLIIYDISGRVVKSFNSTISTKNQISKIHWFGNDDSGRKLPPGAYFLVIKTFEFVVEKKVVKAN